MRGTESFERLLERHRGALERCVRFRVDDPHAADDILQETLLAAWRGFGALREESAFKPWLLQIAQNKCRDYFRAPERGRELPLELADELSDPALGLGHERFSVRETLERLPRGDRMLLYLRYFHDLPEREIADRLGVPVGTVKSRLHAAKRRFRAAWANGTETKGEIRMENVKKLPEILPPYRIEWLDEPPFPLRWEEVMGWFIVPRLGETLRWAMYDFPERKRTMSVDMAVTGRAQVHGVEGVEIRAREYDPVASERADAQNPVERTLIAQLTDTHCRILAESHMQNGVRRLYTFLDGDSFLGNWGFGEDNCGNEVALAPKGDITRAGSAVTTKDKRFLLDAVGRCAVTLGDRTFDTVCVMDCETYDEGVVSEQFLDRDGRTVLWRRFNRDDWRIDRYGKRWSELLPDNERITVNGVTYVHWYDCITDHVL